MAKSVDPDQTAPIGAVCSWSTLFVSILNSSLILGSYLQLTTSADDTFRCIFFLALKGLKFQKESLMHAIGIKYVLKRVSLEAKIAPQN